MNLNLIYFMYGLAYFTMGIVVFVRIRPLIDNRLAKAFGWLVVFGLIHAIHEWIEMFVLMGHTGPVILFIGTIIVTLSFAVLLQFSVEFMAIKKKLPRVIHTVPTILFVIWLLYYLGIISYEDSARLAEILSRYTLGFSATFFTTYALISNKNKTPESSYLSRNLFLAGVFFGFYGILTVIVPEADFFPASVFNYTLFIDFVGLPVQIFRMLSAIGITYFIVKSLDVFDVLEKRMLASQMSEMTGALEESEEKYRMLFEHAGDALFIHGFKGNFLEVNQTACKRLGYSKEKLLQMSPMDIDSPEFAELVPPRIKMLREQGHIIFESAHMRQDGKIVPVEISSRIIEYRGKPAILSIARDITERKLSEERDIRQRSLLDGINRVFRETLTCDTAEEVANTCLVVAEELTSSKYGWIGKLNHSGRMDTIALSAPGWEACSMKRSEADIMLNNMELRGIWSRVLKDEKSLIVNDPQSHPDRVGTPEGHLPLTSFLGIPLKRAGRTIGMFALANKESGYSLVDQQDMEALSVAFVEALNRKWAEKALRNSELKYRSLFESANDAIIIFEPEREIILEANSKVCDIYGYSLDKFIGMSLKEISKDSHLGENRINHLLNEGTIDNFETVHIKKDGSLINILVNASVIEFEGKRAVLSIHRDITQHKRVEDKIKQSEEKYRVLSEQLTRANDLKELLLDVITHDLKNPAGVIYGMSEIIADENPDDEMAQLIKDSSDNLLQVIRNASTLAEISLGEEIKKGKLDLSEVIKGVLELYRTPLEKQEMNLEYDFNKPLLINANPIIAEVFKNYISNAIKYASDGKKIIIEIQEENNNIIVRIKDFGKTIPEIDYQRIFRRGIQRREGEKRGRGLGLAIVKRIAEAHDGEVWVEANIPQGNIFYLKIPKK